jgi:hypothetical protein
VFLVLHVFKIQLVGCPGFLYRIQVGLEHRQVGPAVQKFNGLREVIYRAHGKQRTEDE